MSHRTKQVVTALGMGGGVARGVVFAAAGTFILVAAVRFDPDEAKGVDATLRSFTQTPVGEEGHGATPPGVVADGRPEAVHR